MDLLFVFCRAAGLLWGLEVFFAGGAQAGFVGGEGAEGVEAGEAARVVQPEAEVAAGEEFFLKVLPDTGDVFFGGESGKVGLAVEEGAAQDVLGDDEVVGVSEYAAAEAAGRGACGGAVVLDGLGDDLSLIHI